MSWKALAALLTGRDGERISYFTTDAHISDANAVRFHMWGPAISHFLIVTAGKVSFAALRVHRRRTEPETSHVFARQFVGHSDRQNG